MVIKEFLGLCFFAAVNKTESNFYFYEPFLPHAWDSVFFSDH